MTAPDIDTVDNYGGILSNYAPVEDPTTDQDADGMNECKASTAAMTHTATRAWVRIVSQAATPTFPATNVHDSMWGSDLSVRPTPAYTSPGVYTLTWPTTVTDELSASHSLNFRWAKGHAENQACVVCVEVTTSNSVTVRLFDMAGAAADFAGKVLLIEVG